MTGFKRFHLKNDMLLANCFANLIGVYFVNGLLLLAEGVPPYRIWTHPIPFWLDVLFTPFAFVFVTLATLVYEKPIRRSLNTLFEAGSTPPPIDSLAQRRLLNEPFVLIALDFSMWLLAAAIYSTISWLYGDDPEMIQRAFFLSIGNGLITITIAFFLLEHLLQKKLAPLFFPDGGLTSVPRTLRIRIRTRLAALLFACNLIPLVSIVLILLRASDIQQDAVATLHQLRTAIFINAFVFLGIGICLTALISRNLTIPFTEIIQTLRGVKNGRFDKKVQVTTNDEIGYTGDVINEMTEGLRERQRLQQSLSIAKEVQQNLLPSKDPEIEGLDIAGISLYCEETGGDYYDYLRDPADGRNRIFLVVGDVADHGIHSALLMTTARAFLRQRTSGAGQLDRVVADVNRQISRDVEESGRFMTLFICEIDRDGRLIHWVNAGHDPAMLYDRESARFEHLAGNGLPLGVSEGAAYQKFDKRIVPGQIILMGTDGIWEAQSPQGEMFGKERFKAVVRENADRPAKEILQAAIEAVDRFCYPMKKADDITLVVTKITNPGRT